MEKEEVKVKFRDKYTCFELSCPRYGMFSVPECKKYHPHQCVRLSKGQLVNYENEKEEVF